MRISLIKTNFVDEKVSNIYLNNRVHIYSHAKFANKVLFDINDKGYYGRIYNDDENKILFVYSEEKLDLQNIDINLYYFKYIKFGKHLWYYAEDENRKN